MTATPLPDTRFNAATNQLKTHELERTLPLRQNPTAHRSMLLLRAKTHRDSMEGTAAPAGDLVDCSCTLHKSL